MTNPPVLFDKAGPVARITLHRPDVLNVYDTTMRDALWEALRAVADDDEVRAVLFRGSGRAFCAGADLSEFGTAPSQAIARHVRWRRDVWGLLRHLPVPTVVALHGFAIGAGLELAFACDLRLAAEGTKLGLAETRWGMIPAAGGTQGAPRVTGLGTAMDLVLTGRLMDAVEAHQRGVVTEVVEPEALEDRAMALARSMAELPYSAAMLIKRAVHEGLGMPLADGIAHERRLGTLAAAQ